MELRHLRYFVTLAECLNFTRAAERIHVTQSTLSHQIKQMEEELGRTLFERVGKRVLLTDEGELFLAYAKQALDVVDQGIGAIKKSSNELEGEVRIGTTHTFNLGFIPECVAAFLTRHPTAKVVVEELSASDVSARVLAGELDLGIAYRLATAESLSFEPLLHEEMVLAVAPNHPLAGRKRIRLVELHRQKLVLLPHEFATRTMLEECFAACGAEPQVVAEMNTIAPMLGLVAKTDIGAVVAANAVSKASGLSLILLESPTPMRTPGILRTRSVLEQPLLIRTFLSIVRKAAAARGLRAA